VQPAPGDDAASFRRPRRARWRRAARIGRYGGLALLVAVVLVWVWSGWYALQVVYGSASSQLFVRIGRGRLSLIAGAQGTFGMGTAAGLHAGAGRGPPPGWDWGSRFAIRRTPPGGLRVVIPLMLPASLIGVVVVALYYAERRARPKAGECPACGYNRAGLSDDAACPECGWARVLTPAAADSAPPPSGGP
jgi:hypothetical protein